MEFSNRKYGTFNSKTVEKWFIDNPYPDNIEKRKSNLIDLLPDNNYKSPYEFEIPNVVGLQATPLTKHSTNGDQFFAIVILLKAIGIETMVSTPRTHYDLLFCDYILNNAKDLNFIRKLEFVGVKITTQLVMCFLSSFATLFPVNTTNEVALANIFNAIAMFGGGNAHNQAMPVYGEDTIGDILGDARTRNVLTVFFECGWSPFDRRFAGEMKNGHCHDCVLSSFEGEMRTFTGIKDLRCACEMERSVEELYHQYRESVTLFSILHTVKLFPWQ
jgi:hypothetical protein